MTTNTGEMKAKLEPRNAGIFAFVTTMYSSVPTPFMKSTVAGLILNRIGTRTDAPNMANKCWRLKGNDSISGGRSSTWITRRFIDCA